MPNKITYKELFGTDPLEEFISGNAKFTNTEELEYVAILLMNAAPDRVHEIIEMATSYYNVLRWGGRES